MRTRKNLLLSYSSCQKGLPHLANIKIRPWMDGSHKLNTVGFANSRALRKRIRRDYAAVRAAFTSEWSNGPVEAQVNCLKLQKRLMFGRANFDVLRLRVLRRA